ncbi:MAG: V-type ATPase subunit [Candidatus Omnitrophica bacterium]|nr:V-type ATPase subunit [Candidatus Omnitrophota bacterium]
MTGQDIRYAYATGRIRALEKRLLNKQAFERLIESQPLSEAILIIQEYGLSPHLNENLATAYKILDELSLDKKVTHFFRVKYDFHNLKVALKSKFMDLKEECISHLGLFDFGLIKKMANREWAENIPFDYLSLVRKVENVSLQLLNFTIDKAMVDYTLGLLEKYCFLRDYFRRYIDLKNLNFYFRLYRKSDILKDALLDGGYINKIEFLREVDIRKIRRYEAIINIGTEALMKKGDSGFFEKVCDDYLLNFLKPAKYMPFGIEPLFAYVVALEYQAKSINAILFCKKNEIPKDIIRKHLRESYV